MFEDKIARGARWLDIKHPGWEDRIDLDTLNMNYATKCVLGQIVGSNRAYYDHSNQFRIDYGFELEFSFDSEYDTLRDEWIAFIEKRRGVSDAVDSINAWADSEPVEVSQEGLNKALDVIRSIHDNTDAYVPELTPQGALMTLLMDLGIRIKVV